MKTLLLAVLAVLLIAACSGPVSGTVVGKRYDPQDMTLMPMPMTQCIPTCKKTICTTNIIWLPINDDEDYILIVRDAEGKDHEREVDKSYWDEAEVGDGYSEVSQ